MSPVLAYLMMIDSDEGKARFTAIYNKYKNSMFHSAYRILKNTHDAEDMVHEAFVVAIENLDRLSDPDAPATRAFLLMVTENKAIDLWRRKKRMPDSAPYEEQSGIAVHLPEPIGLSEAIAALPGDYRSVILLRFHMGFTTQEIARMLGKKESAVAKTITRAKERLSRELEKMRREEEQI